MLFIIEIKRGRGSLSNTWLLDVLDTRDWTTKRINEHDYTELIQKNISIFPCLKIEMKDAWKERKYGYLEEYGDIHFLTMFDVHYKGSESFTNDIDLTIQDFGIYNNYRDYEQTSDESTTYTFLYYKSKCLLMGNTITGDCIVLPIKTGILASMCYIVYKKTYRCACYLDFKTGELINLMYMYTNCTDLCEKQREYSVLSELCKNPVTLYKYTTDNIKRDSTDISRYYMMSEDLTIHRFKDIKLKINIENYQTLDERGYASKLIPHVDLTKQLQIEIPVITNKLQGRVTNILNEIDTGTIYYIFSWEKKNSYSVANRISSGLRYIYKMKKQEIQRLLLDYINHKEWNNMERWVEHYNCANVYYDYMVHTNQIVLKIQSFKHLWNRYHWRQNMRELWYSPINIVSVADRWWI